MKNNKIFRSVCIGLLGAWLGIFVLLPFLMVLLNSFSINTERGGQAFTFTLSHYQQTVNPFYVRILLRSIFLSLFVALCCIFIAYPFAFFLSQLKSARLKAMMLLLTIIPFWTSTLVRTYAIMTLVRAKGFINHLLLSWGLIHHPLPLLYTKTAVVIGLTYNLLPFMILPLFANMEKLDNTYFEAAKDLGANSFQLFTRVMLPMTLPGILSGSVLVILSCMTLFYIPDILGGAKSLLLGNVITNQFLSFNNWPMGSAMGMSLTFIVGVLFFLYTRRFKKRFSSSETAPMAF